MRTHGWGMAMAAAMILTSAANAGTRPVDETHPAAADAKVRIESVVGRLTVTGWDRNEVQVKGTIDDRLEFEMNRDERLIVVKVRWPERKSRHMNLDGSDCILDVKVPSGADLETQGVSLDIEITGVRGEIEAESVSGEITISGPARAIAVQAVSGDIEIDSDCDDVSVEAVSGEIRAKVRGGNFEAQAVSGDISVEGAAFNRVSIESVSGSVDFAGSLPRGSRVDIDCHSGDVDLRLTGDVSAEFEVSTFSGDIDSDFGGRAERTSKYAPGSEYEATVGDGGARVSIDAFSGTVRLRKR